MIENGLFSRLYAHQWMTLPRETRMELRRIFNLPQTNVVEVRDNIVLTDGVTNDDLLQLTLDKLEWFTNKKGTFAELFEKTIQLIQNPVVVQLDSICIMPLKDEVKSEVKPEVKQVEKKTEKKIDWSRYCQDCDSKGGRHLKNCPKFK